MSENMMADLLAAQKEMPALQKSAINPHFKNRYVPLEELVQAVVPILNKHNFVLIQQPCAQDGQPALTTRLLHTSGGEVEATMYLLASKDDPQGQGSGITYARRYALMSFLGLTADADDDAEATRTAPAPSTFAQTVRQGVAGARRVAPPAAPTRTQGTACPICGGQMWDNRPKKADGSFSPKAPDFKCRDKTCEGVIWPGAELSEEETGVDPDSLPFE